MANKVIETTEHIDYNTGEVKSSTIIRKYRGDGP